MIRILFLSCSAISFILLLANDAFESYRQFSSGAGYANYLLGFELLACVFCVAALMRHALSEKRFPTVFGYSVLALTLLLFAGNQLFWFGKPPGAATLICPGTPLSRLLLLDIPWGFRRLLEPMSWLLIALLFGNAYRSKSKATTVSAILLIVTLCLEAMLLRSRESWGVMLPWLDNNGVLITYLLLQAALLTLLYSLTVSLYKTATISSNNESARGPKVIAALMSLLVLGTAVTTLKRGDSPVLGGAYYYSWFPENWKGGYSGRRYANPIEPELGEYHSADHEVFTRHVRFAQEAKLDYFIFDWWPERPDVRAKIATHLKDKLLWKDFQFSIHYEALDLKLADTESVATETENTIYLTPTRSEHLKKHFEFIAKHYMKHPAYLRIDGRPVLFVYATRHLVGPVARAIEVAREHVYQTTGEQLFLIADDVYYNVISYSRSRDIYLKPTFEPEWDRIRAFDGITAYNPFDPQRARSYQRPKSDAYLSDVKTLFARYRAVASTLGLIFIPSVIPGYDDRGIREVVSHPFALREIPNSPSLFSRGLEETVRPFLDRGPALFAVTSWNEWNEGTQIEPARASANPPPAHGPVFDNVYAAYKKQHLSELSRAREEWLKTSE